MSSLRDCHKVETDQYVRNCIVESMRDIDPGAKGLPPLIYNYSSLDWGTQGFRYVWLTRAWTGYYSGPWVSVTDNTAPSGTNQALVQTDRSPQTAVRESFYAEPARNIEMRVSIKAIRGDVEQGGGLVWRHQDLRNYYAAGINPRDGSLRLVRRADDKLVQLGGKDGLKLSAREWYTLSVKHVDDKIECSLDGTKYLEAGDSSIPWSGFFGMWTRADAETHFDGLRVIDYGE